MDYARYRSFNEIVEYFIRETYPDEYKFDDFYNSWKYISRKLSYLIKCIEDIKVFFSSDIFVVQESGILLGVCEEILKDNQRIEELYVSAANASGLFKGFKFSKSVKDGEKKLKELHEHATIIHKVLAEIYEKYPKTFEEKIKMIYTSYPFLLIQKMDDYKAIIDMNSKNLMNGKIFNLLNKFVFPHFKDHSVSSTRLLELIEQLKDPAAYKVYFTNVQFFKDYVSKAKILEDINIFFDKELFIIGKSFLSIIPVRIESNIQLSRFLELRALLNDKEHAKEIISTINHLSNSNIIFERVIFEYRTTDIIDYFNSDIVDALVLFGIKRIHNTYDLDCIYNLKKIFVRNNNFKGYLYHLSKLWKKIIAEEARNLQHMLIFFQLIDLIGIKNMGIFEENNFILNGADIIDLNILIEKWVFNKKIDLKEFIDNLNNKNKRKIILVTMPKTDYNNAFSSTFPEINKIPKDKYKIHYSFISTALNLANVIKDVAKYGKIDIIMIGGHGDPSGTYFDMFNPNNLKKDILNHYLFDNIHKCFSKNAKGYLVSCSTGQDPKGIAYALSKKFRIPVYAPKIPTSGHIEVTDDDVVCNFGEGIAAEFKP